MESALDPPKTATVSAIWKTIILFLWNGERVLFVEKGIKEKRWVGFEIKIQPNLDPRVAAENFIRSKMEVFGSLRLYLKAEIKILDGHGQSEVTVFFVRGAGVRLSRKHAWFHRPHLPFNGILPGAEEWLKHVANIPGTVAVGSIACRGSSVDLSGIRYVNTF